MEPQAMPPLATTQKYKIQDHYFCSSFDATCFIAMPKAPGSNSTTGMFDLAVERQIVSLSPGGDYLEIGTTPPPNTMDPIMVATFRSFDKNRTFQASGITWDSNGTALVVTGLGVTDVLAIDPTVQSFQTFKFRSVVTYKGRPYLLVAVGMEVNGVGTEPEEQLELTLFAYLQEAVN